MEEIKYKSNRNVVYKCDYHVIFCPKYRAEVLKDGVDKRLKEIIIELCKEKKVEVLAMEIMPDHCHLMLDVDPQFGINTIVKLIKGRSSRYLRAEFPHLKELPTLWTNSYFCATVGGAPLYAVKKYIEGQKTRKNIKAK